GIISKYPIQLREKIHLAGHIEVQQRMIVKIENQEVVIYNIEMTAPWMRQQKILPFFTIPSYDFSQRSAEIKELITRIKQENLPVIAAGDFNLTDQSQDYHNLSQLLQDSFQVSGWGFGWTWPTNWAMNNFIKTSTWKLNSPLFRLDYIWHSHNWQTKSSKVLPSIDAAHLPVVSELYLLN
ncbi:MAG: endonuclease/exonuclease/phosphatase family protein, partial [Trichodesmium sp.]